KLCWRFNPSFLKVKGDLIRESVPRFVGLSPEKKTGNKALSNSKDDRPGKQSQDEEQRM
ncbi:hypothetical protein Golax_014875, partial [Gossypium laxum]|nr:hypothetical protein [Gossypium laxum]